MGASSKSPIRPGAKSRRFESKSVIGVTRNLSTGLYVVALIVVVVAIDLLFFRNRLWFWERLMANVGMVLLFLAFYLRFMRNE